MRQVLALFQATMFGDQMFLYSEWKNEIYNERGRRVTNVDVVQVV